MAGLTASLLDHMMFAKEGEAKQAGAGQSDIVLSRESGMDARDIMNLRRFTATEKLLIIIRCPKRSARAWHGSFPAKTFATKEKTGDSGTVQSKTGLLMVSDYDMMSVWRSNGSGYAKIYISPVEHGSPKGPFSPEARDLVKAMNRFLISKIQHGCQDDFYSTEKNPGVKTTDHFLAIRTGDGLYLRDPLRCAAFYMSHALDWPYLSNGKHNGRGLG